MKKAFYLFAAGLALLACTKELPQESGIRQKALSFELTVNHPDGAGTKSVKTGWESGDVVYVFFDGAAAPKYLKMSYDGSKWTKTQMNGSSAQSFDLNKTSGKMTAVYLPFGNDATVEADADGTSFKFNKKPLSWYFVSEKADYKVADGIVTGTLTMSLPKGFVLFSYTPNWQEGPVNPALASYESLFVPYTNPACVASISADGTVKQDLSQEIKNLPGYAYKESIIFSGVVKDSYLDTDKGWTLHLSTLVNVEDRAPSYYTKSWSSKALTTGNVVQLPALSSWTKETYRQPVDMGLSVLWANTNIGSTKPEDPTISYYAWADPLDDVDRKYSTPVKPFNEANYKWYSSNHMIKYNDVDNYVYLSDANYEDDQARQIWGGRWSVPTRAQWNELIDNCDIAWDATRNGYLFTSNKNGKSIFLRTTGGYTGDSLDSMFYDRDQLGRYWTATVDTGGGGSRFTAFALIFKSDSGPAFNSVERVSGFAIRPVWIP